MDNQHDDAHDYLGEVHERAHEEGLSPWEHARLHRDLDAAHRYEHRQLQRQHNREHRRNDWQRRYRSYNNYYNGYYGN